MNQTRINMIELVYLIFFDIWKLTMNTCVSCAYHTHYNYDIEKNAHSTATWRMKMCMCVVL